VSHVDDPIADRGRAVLSDKPLPIKGRLIVGTREQNYGPGALHAINLPDGKMTKIADTTEPRVARNGAIVDRVDMRTLVVRDKDGKEAGRINLDPNEADTFAISDDGQKIAVSMERLVEVPDALPKREIATLVFDVQGKKLGEVVGYDDPAFMPDGRLLLTGRGGGEGLFIGDYTSGKLEPLEIKDTDDGKQPDWPRMPAVSPDGKKVAYVSGRLAYVVGIDGRGWTPVWNPGADPEPQTEPTFSPDGSLIAVNIIPLNVMTGPGTISIFDLKTHVRQPLPNTKGADSDTPIVWQPQ
jgi:Tol biopolymer transport system component